MFIVHRDKKKICAGKVIIRLMAVGTKNLVIEVGSMNEPSHAEPGVFPLELILRRPIKD